MAEIFDLDSAELVVTLPTKWIDDNARWEEIVSFAKLSKLFRDGPRSPWTLWDEENSDLGEEPLDSNEKERERTDSTLSEGLPTSGQSTPFDIEQFRPIDRQQAAAVPAKRVRSSSNSFQEEIRQCFKRIRSEKDSAESSRSTTVGTALDRQDGGTSTGQAGGEERTWTDEVEQLVETCFQLKDKFSVAAKGDEETAAEALSKVLTKLQKDLVTRGGERQKSLEKDASKREKRDRRTAARGPGASAP